MLCSVKYYRAHRYLTEIALAPCLGGYYSRKQLKVRRGISAGGRFVYTECLKSFLARNAVGVKSVIPLKGDNGIFCTRAEYAVGIVGLVALTLECLLNFSDLIGA